MRFLDQRTVPRTDQSRPRIGQGRGAGGATRVMPVFSPRRYWEPDYSPDTDPSQAGISRDRSPAFHQGNVNSGTGWVNWTAAGPVRMSLGMDNISLNRWQGSDGSRFLQNPRDPDKGLHTTPRPNYRANLDRLDNAHYPDMQGRGINRLSPSRYAGQSFSETTLQQR